MWHCGPVDRQVAIVLGTLVAQRLVQDAAEPHELCGALTARSVTALEAHAKADQHELDRVEPLAGRPHRRVEALEEADARRAVLKEPRRHPLMDPGVAVGARKVLDDVVGRGAKRVLAKLDVLARGSRGQGLALVAVDHLRHVAEERTAIDLHYAGSEAAQEHQ